MKGIIAGLTETFGKTFVNDSTNLKVIFFGLLLVCSSFSFAQEASIASDQSAEQVEININQADAEAISDALSGVGIKKAEAIVAYRDENGAYDNVDDLIMVKGIGEVTILKNEERIVFD